LEFYNIFIAVNTKTHNPKMEIVNHSLDRYYSNIMANRKMIYMKFKSFLLLLLLKMIYFHVQFSVFPLATKSHNSSYWIPI